MGKAFLAALFLVLASAQADAGVSQRIEHLRDAPTEGECCKVCRKGKACGDTCIARERECHEPPGCACDG